MTAPSQLGRAIRFALSDLSSQNAHHEFERLCRHIAKRRIACNVIPATGPVAAGGDQGRDFETFHTYLREQLPFAMGFLALVAEDVVVFACTLQGDDLPSKIRADIQAICSQGSPVDRIVVFTAQNVPVARRHGCRPKPATTTTSTWRSMTARRSPSCWLTMSCSGSPRNTCIYRRSCNLLPRSTTRRCRTGTPRYGRTGRCARQPRSASNSLRLGKLRSRPPKFN